MPEPSLRPQTAPRTLEGLMKETPFKLRLLATELGGLQTEQDKMAWHDLKTAAVRASYILGLLEEYDRQNPGAAQAAQPTQANANGTAQAGPPPQPTTTFVPAVTPAALAVATAATAADKPKRTPRTSATDASPQAQPATLGAEQLGANVLGFLTQLIEANKTQEASFRQFASMLEEAAGSKTSRITALEAKHNELTGKLDKLLVLADGLQQLQAWTLMAFLTFVKDQMGGSMLDVLGAAVADSEDLAAMVEQVRGGKG